jgi:hypothetical protein
MPPEATKAYAQAEHNFPNTEMNESAVASYGRALDVGLKRFETTVAGEKKGMLFARIERLAEENQLPKQIAEWAHEIRLFRNEALHDLDDVSRSDVEAVRAITEMIMRSLFTIPGIIAAVREQTKAAEG